MIFIYNLLNSSISLLLIIPDMLINNLGCLKKQELEGRRLF